MNKLIPIIVISILMIGSTPAFALKLLAVNPDNTMFQTAIHIPDPFNNSYFTLEVFEREGQSSWYTFAGRAGQVILIQTQVPNIPSSFDFTPCFDLLIGQDKFTPTVDRKPFFEDLTNTDWIITCELRMTLPSTGLYFIRAHDELHNYHIGDTGKFSVFVGEVDNLSFLDWIQVPFWILAVNQFFENVIYVWIMLILLFSIAVIVFVMINRRGKSN